MEKGNNTDFALRKKNYRFMIIGMVLVVLGFILMVGGGSEDPTVFNYDELYSFRRITLAPFTILLGYVIVMYGIMLRDKSQNEN